MGGCLAECEWREGTADHAENADEDGRIGPG